MSSPRTVYLFGPFRVEVSEQRLLRDDETVPLTPKVFQTLLVLLENAGRLVTKDELMRRLWPDTFVAEVTLAHNVSMLRKALGDGRDGRVFIQTVAKSGYRFVGEVRRAEDAEQPSAAAPSEATAAASVPEIHTAPSHLKRRAIAGALATTALVAVAIAVWTGRARTRSDGAQPPRAIAVLPFRSLGGTSDDAFLELGLAEAVIRRLSTLASLTVRPLGSVESLRGPSVDALAAGRSLSVDAVLEGTVQRRPDGIRVTAVMYRVADAKMLWSAAVTEQSSNLLQAEETLSAQLLSSLWPAVAAQRPRARPSDPVAWELYLRGRHLWNQRTSDSYRKAVELLTQATDREPSFAEAWATLADAHLLIAGEGDAPEHRRLAHRALENALRLDEGLGEAHTTVAMEAQNFEYDWEKAEREYRRAIELSPGDPTPVHRLGELLALLGRFDEGLALLARARRMDPVSPVIATDHAKALGFARRFDEAQQEAAAVLELHPSFALAHLIRAANLAGAGRKSEAGAPLERYVELDSSPYALTLAAGFSAMAGEQRRAEELLARARAANEGGAPACGPCLAIAYAQLGRKAEALDWLERTYREGGILLGTCVHPALEPLYGEPRFQALCAKVRLPNKL